MQCEEIIKREVKSVTQTDKVEYAARIMLDADLGFLPVCDDAEHVIGTITDRDLALRIVAEGAPGSSPVGLLMTHDVVACRPSDDLRRAEELMSERHKSRLMVTDDTGRLVG